MPTLRDYRRALARALDDLGVYTLTSPTASTLICTLLVNASPGASTHRYDGRWLYLAAPIPQQRVVTTGGYNPGDGTLTFAPTATPATAGTEVELTGLFPSLSVALSEDTDYRTLVNRALAALLVHDRLTVAITTADSYPIAAYPWLDRMERLVGVLEPSPVSGRRPVDAGWRGWRLVVDGPTPRLEVNAPFATASGDLTLDVLRPANTLVNGTDSTTGLVDDTDTAVPAIEEFLPVGLMEAYQALMSRTPGRPNSNWHQKWAEAREMAHRLRAYDRTSEIEATAPPAGSGQAVLPPSVDAA